MVLVPLLIQNLGGGSTADVGLVVEIGKRLSSQSVASTAAGSTSFLLRYFELPSTHDRAVTVVPIAGFGMEYATNLDRPGVQVLVRASANGASELEDKADAIVAALNLIAHTTNLAGSGREYVDIRKTSDPIWLGRDDNDRPIMAVNFYAMRSRTT